MDSLEQQLTKILARHSDLRLAILFGSQATGQATHASDVDVGVPVFVPWLRSAGWH